VSVIEFRPYTQPSRIPTLVLVDMQQEYVAAPRGLALPSAAEALPNCRAALAHARALGFPVAFVRWIGKSHFFNPATPFSNWIEGFEPNGHDMVFERDRPSCYASARFAEVMTVGGGNFVMAGFAGEAACLSTAIDAFHRNHRFVFLGDASASHACEDVEAADIHRAVARVINLYGDVMETGAWIAATSGKRSAWGG
jgi:nicotinamidase-related amidase